MNKNYVFRSIMLIIVVVILVFTPENYQNGDASKNSHSKDNFIGSTIPLPFNSHIADQSTHEKRDSSSSSSIPFP